MTADEALNSYLIPFGVDPTSMSYAEKFGMIYGKGFKSGLDVATEKMLEVILNQQVVVVDGSENRNMDEWERGWLEAFEWMERWLETLREGDDGV